MRVGLEPLKFRGFPALFSADLGSNGPPEYRIYFRPSTTQQAWLPEVELSLRRSLNQYASKAIVRAQTDHFVIASRVGSAGFSTELASSLRALNDTLSLTPFDLQELDPHVSPSIFDVVGPQIWSTRPVWLETPRFDFRSVAESEFDVDPDSRVFVMAIGVSEVELKAALSLVERLRNRGTLHIPLAFDLLPSSELECSARGTRSSIIVATAAAQRGAAQTLADVAASQHLLGGEGSQLFDQLRDMNRVTYSIQTQAYQSLMGTVNITTFSVRPGREVQARESIKRILSPEAERSLYREEPTRARIGLERWINLARGRGLFLDFLCNLAATDPQLNSWLDAPESLLELSTTSVERSLARVREGTTALTTVRAIG